MHKRSILKFVIILFVITIVAINSAFYFEYDRRLKQTEYYTFERFVLGIRVRTNGGEDIVKLLKNIGLKFADIPNDEIRKNGVKKLYDSYCDMIYYKNTLFFVPREKDSSNNIVITEGSEFEDMDISKQANYITALENTQKFSFGDFWVLLFTINGINLGFFALLLIKLFELRKLKKQIESAGDNKIFTPISTRNNDELGAIATAFNSTMIKIDNIKEAKALFLRNILHELRTPVMKGKLIASTSSDENSKNRLKQIFARQEIILNEIVKVEKFSSNEWELSKNEYRLIDIIDHAVDLLLLENTGRINVSASKKATLVNVDFELFATAVKNLIDNALKYSKERVDIEIFSDKFVISSVGEKIDEARLDFDRAFNRKSEVAGSGLGLGMYIANQIFTKHGFVMRHEYKQGKNCFVISL